MVIYRRGSVSVTNIYGSAVYLLCIKAVPGEKQFLKLLIIDCNWKLPVNSVVFDNCLCTRCGLS